jgi:hypothetical protein
LPFTRRSQNTEKNPVRILITILYQTGLPGLKEIHTYTAAIALYCHRNLARRGGAYTKCGAHTTGFVSAMTIYCCKILDRDHVRAKPK